MRLIDETGAQLGIVPIQRALGISTERGYDLVEIAPGSRPPVCKLIDYGKYRYELIKKTKEAKKKQKIVHIKEIKMRPAIGIHDYQFKMKHAMEFLARGDKVKFTIMFRGRERAHMDIIDSLIRRILDEVKDITDIEKHPSKEGPFMMLIVAPKSR